MAVWGIGAYFLGTEEDKSKEFVNENRIIIGYQKEEHPEYYKMLYSIKTCDIVFIKARYMKNKPLKVKAIGIVISDKPSIENGLYGREGIKVKWIKDFTDNPIDLEKGNDNDGSTKSIYQETDSNILYNIAQLLNL